MGEAPEVDTGERPSTAQPSQAPGETEHLTLSSGDNGAGQLASPKAAVAAEDPGTCRACAEVLRRQREYESGVDNRLPERCLDPGLTPQDSGNHKEGDVWRHAMFNATVKDGECTTTAAGGQSPARPRCRRRYRCTSGRRLRLSVSMAVQATRSPQGSEQGNSGLLNQTAGRTDLPATRTLPDHLAEAQRRLEHLRLDSPPIGGDPETLQRGHRAATALYNNLYDRHHAQPQRWCLLQRFVTAAATTGGDQRKAELQLEAHLRRCQKLIRDSTVPRVWKQTRWKLLHAALLWTPVTHSRTRRRSKDPEQQMWRWLFRSPPAPAFWRRLQGKLVNHRDQKLFANDIPSGHKLLHSLNIDFKPQDLPSTPAISRP
ncbi:UNVERIFIED_CONTAM: hypothetical protein K2H54_075959 [Gekko kuhli]